MLKSEFFSRRKPFKVNISKSLKLGRQSRYFFGGRFVLQDEECIEWHDTRQKS